MVVFISRDRSGLMTSPLSITGMMGIGFGESSPNGCKFQLFSGCGFKYYSSARI
jgi:hypothetical protein